MGSESSLNVFPEEREKLADRLLAGEIGDEEYFAEVRRLDEEADRQIVRDRLEKKLRGSVA